jgi:hypothetical protein
LFRQFRSQRSQWILVPTEEIKTSSSKISRPIGQVVQTSQRVAMTIVIMRHEKTEKREYSQRRQKICSGNFDVEMTGCGRRANKPSK